ncbi:MAG: hypothetical protein F6K04_23000 [Leptolyngbya sp. SIO4C5]|nr:hypothetical protein [Leptolyngbya sp. SIO4C5]
MTQSSSGEETHPENSVASQSLTQIRGIGEAKRQWFESVGIKTLSDLAKADVDQITAQLQAAEHAVTEEQVEEWVEQARSRIEATSATETQAAETADRAETEVLSEATADADAGEAIETEVATSEVTTGEDAETAASEALDSEVAAGEAEVPQAIASDWRSLAAFRIWFESREVSGQTQQRTRIEQVDSSEHETWSGLEKSQLQQWMLARLPETTAVAETAVEPAERVAIAIEKVYLKQAAQVMGTQMIAQSGQTFTVPLEQNTPFALEVVFSFLNLAESASAVTEVNCQLQAQMQNRTSGESIAFSQTQTVTLDAKQALYSITLSDLQLASGIYRLRLLITLPSLAAIPGFFEIPALQVT